MTIWDAKQPTPPCCSMAQALVGTYRWQDTEDLISKQQIWELDKANFS